MSRNSSGTYTLPAGNPVVTATTISTTWANTTLGDLAAELTDSLSRSAKGGLLAVLRGIDGTVAAPAYSFTSEVGSGLYRAAANDLRLALSGADALQITATFLALFGAAPVVRAAAANAPLNLQGNRTATDVNADVAMTSLATRTAGLLLDVQNNGAGKFQVDYQGLARLVSQAAALQPASVLTAVTPATNISASASYWKDATGTVHIQGSVAGSGAAIVHGTLLFNLPSGFRPDSTRAFATLDTSKNLFGVQVASTGDVTLIAPVSVTSAGSTNLANGGPGLFLDVISFLARG